MNRTRFPRRVYANGVEPDPRFSLANERTFLAWIRTSLALVAAGIALEALALPIHEKLRFAAAMVFISLGLLAAVQSFLGWVHTERSLRLQRPLPGPSLGIALTIGVILGIALITVGLFL